MIHAFPARFISFGWIWIVAEATPEVPQRITVIGIGNPDRGDDGAGRAVARLLKGVRAHGTVIVETNGDVAELLDKMDDEPTVFLIDACLSGVTPGTVRRFDVGHQQLPRDTFGASTHGLGLAQAIDLARVLGRLPPRCVVIAIEGKSFEIGAPLSPEVEEAVVSVANQLRAELASVPGSERLHHA